MAVTLKDLQEINTHCCKYCSFHFGGSCRKNPPVVAFKRDHTGQFVQIGIFPPVEPHWWCGEYTPDTTAHMIHRTITAHPDRDLSKGDKGDQS